MAGGTTTLTSNLVLSLINKVTGPARQAAASLRDIGAAAEAINGRRVTTAADRIAAAMASNNERIAAMRGRMVEATASAYVLARALSSPIKAAMDFESAMSDVRKVVDFDTPEAFKRFQVDVLAMSTRIPMAASALSEIVAAAGQAGIAREDLLKFTEIAAKVGVAFDISAGQAGDSMSKLMTGLGLTVGEVERLADAMNHLSNSQASSAAEIMDVVRRVGGQAKMFGLSATETAAFASAMISAGAQSDVAATSLNAMGRALTKGTAATKSQRTAFRALGLDAGKVSKAMQKDAVGTITNVMERIAALPEHQRASISSMLFGDEARALGPLLTNLDLLRASLGLVADETEYAGSSQREYEARSKTTANAIQLFQNRANRLAIRLGEALLPALTAILDHLSPLIDTIADLATRFPRATAAVVALAAGFVALRIATAAAGYASAVMKGGLLTAALPLAKLAGGVSRLAKIVGAATLGMFRLNKVAKAAGPAATAGMAGMSLVSQNLGKSSTAAKRASDLMVAGMNAGAIATQAASRSMIAGMAASSAAIGSASASSGKVRAIASAIMSIAAASGAARVAMTALKVALVTTGVGAAVVAIGAAVAFVYQNWNGLVEMVKAFGEAFVEHLGPARSVIEPVVTAVGDLFRFIGDLTGEIDASGDRWRAWGKAAGEAAAGFVNDVVALPGRIGDALAGLWSTVRDAVSGAFDDATSAASGAIDRMVAFVEALPGRISGALAGLAADLYAEGTSAVQGLLDGMAAKVEELVSWVAGIPGRIVAAIGNIDLSNIIKWPSMPSWLGGGAPAPAGGSPGAADATPKVDGARAAGGPVWPGGSFLVGEEGPEIFKPRAPGEIIPNREAARTKAAPAAAPRISAPVTIHAPITITGVSDPAAAAERVVQELDQRFRAAVRGMAADYGIEVA